MITLASAQITKKNTLHGGGQWIWLLEVDRDSSNTLYYARAQHDVTFNGQTYTAKPIVLKPPDSDQAGSIFQFAIKVPNIDGVVGGYVKSGEIIDQAMSLIRVHRDTLSDATALVRIRGHVQRASISSRWVGLQCGPLNYREVILPKRRYLREICEWPEHKGDACKYAGVETSCDRLYATCLNTMSNEENFGGFRGIKVQRP